MNEEEILQKLNKYIELINKGYCDDCNELNVICGKSCNGSQNVKDAIESLIEIYKQEKEKNKELEEKQSRLAFKTNQYMNDVLTNNIISKDKIKELLENEIIDISGFRCIAVEDIENLLEEK